MKRALLSLPLVCIFIFSLYGCSIDPHIPGGYIKKDEYFEKDAFQDSTDYCKYYYSDNTWFENNSDYERITESDINTVSGYFSDFKNWMYAEDRSSEYDFDINCITEGDYVKIFTKEGEGYPKYGNYTIYFFDSDSCVLYYIHNNI